MSAGTLIRPRELGSGEAGGVADFTQAPPAELDPVQSLEALVASGDTLAACAEAGRAREVSQIADPAFRRLAKAGVKISFISADKVCEGLLEAAATEAEASLPKGDNVGGRLEKLYAGLFSLETGQADRARRILDGYDPAAAFSSHVGRALTCRPDPTKNRWRAILVQPDGSVAAMSVSDAKWWRKKSSATALLEALTDHGYETDETWAGEEGNPVDPFGRLLYGRRLPKTMRSQPVPSQWQPPESPVQVPSKRRPLTNHSLAEAVHWQVGSHPGVIAIRGVRKNIQARPLGLKPESSWAFDGRVSKYMLQVAKVVQPVGRLLARESWFRTRPYDMIRTLAHPILAAQIYALGEFRQGLPNGGLELTAMLTAFQRAQEAKSLELGIAATLCIAAMAARGPLVQGGISRETADGIIADTVMNRTGNTTPDIVRASRKQATRLRKNHIRPYLDDCTPGTLAGIVSEYTSRLRTAQAVRNTQPTLIKDLA
jgi:hypothetical protein